MINTICKLLLVLFLVVSCSLIARSQHLPWKATIGVGFIDLIHVGTCYAISHKNELSVQLGSVFIDNDNSLWVPAIEHKLFLEKSTKYEDLNTWYFGQKLIHYYEKSDVYKWNTLFVNAYAGRDFNFSEKLGLSLDAGLLLKTLDRQTRVSDGSEVENDEPDRDMIMPSIRLQLFHRF